MDKTEIVELQFLVVGIMGMFGLALAIIFFVILYQRKLLNQQKKMEEERTNYQKDLLQALLDAQEAERIRIGRDLHDDIGSMLATAKLYLQHQSHLPKSHDTNWIMKADDVLTDTVKNLGVIARDLVPTILHQLGLLDAIEAMVDVIRESSHLEISCQIEDIPPLSDSLGLHIYRIIQELCNNVLKHAEASSVGLELGYREGEIWIEFRDDGKGMSEEATGSKYGLGLKNIQSRLELMNGNIQISTDPLTGTHFSIRLPYETSQV